MVNVCAKLSMSKAITEVKALNLQIKNKLLTEAHLVPQVTVHESTVCFSSTLYTTPIRGSIFAATISPLDAHRLVISATQLIKENFSLSIKEMKKVQCRRPHTTDRM